MTLAVRAGLSAFFIFFASLATASAADEIYTGRFNNLAVQGYDAVAYFTQAEAVKGDADFATDYKGATWRFSSQDNLDAFIAAPESYAPAYGGYCAWAVAQGYTAKGDARHWRIVDGVLYLNFNAKVQRDWEEDIPGFIAAADANWPGVLN